MAVVEDAVLNALDLAVRENDTPFNELAVVHTDRDSDYADWYSQALVALALLVGDDELKFGNASLSEDKRSSVIFVLSSRLALVATVEGIGDASTRVSTSAVPRHAIRSVTLETDLRVKQQRGRLLPGGSTVTVVYDGVEAAVVVHGPNQDRFDLSAKASPLKLLELVRSDVRSPRD